MEKHFASREDWAREVSLYDALGGSLPLVPVLYREPGLLVTEYAACPTMLEVLESQEKTAFSPEPWRALAAWLRRCWLLCGQLPAEGNLGDFLWDASGGQVLGLDLEQYAPLSLTVCGASLATVLLACGPAETSVKKQAAALLVQELDVPAAALAEAQRNLAPHRRDRPPLSGIVLAGGASRRMGTSKANLLLEGRPLLTWQVEKLQALHIQDVLLSGKDCPALPGTRVVPDELPDRGPLGGLHACFRAARNASCLVLSVDTPLTPCSALAKLCGAHTAGITLLRHGWQPEPLTGVYDASLAEAILPLIQEEGAPVRALTGLTGPAYFDYLGPEELLTNCNTPEQFEKVRRLAEDYARLFGKAGGK